MIGPPSSALSNGRRQSDKSGCATPRSATRQQRVTLRASEENEAGLCSTGMEPLERTDLLED